MCELFWNFAFDPDDDDMQSMQSSIQKEISVHLNHANVELSHKEGVMHGRSIREGHQYVI